MHKFLLVPIVITLSLNLNGCAHRIKKVAAHRETPVSAGSLPRAERKIFKKFTFTDKQMVSGQRLSARAKKELIYAQRRADEAGGAVHVICPASATSGILEEIGATGVTYNRDKGIRNGYAVILFKRQ